MYKLVQSTQFKKDFKKIAKSKSDVKLVVLTLKILEKEGVEGLPIKFKPHKLKGDYKDDWECHIKPDLLLIWFQIEEPTKEIRLIRLGSHTELFD